MITIPARKNIYAQYAIASYMDDAFIVVSVITSLFGILGLLILDRNWFRRERFKFEQDTQKKEYNLRFKKMARDMGLDTKTPPYRAPAASSLMDTAAPLLSLAKNLKPGQLEGLLDVLGGGGGEEPPEEGGEILPGGISGLLDFAEKNPQLVKGFIDGLNKTKQPPGGEGGFI